MTITKILDKIIRESDVNAKEYTLEHRLEDVNEHHFFLIEKATQLGATFGVSGGETSYEEFTLIVGDNTFVRTLPDVPIVKVQYTNHDNPKESNWMDVPKSFFSGNEKEITFFNARAGKARVTYQHGAITKFTMDDYTNETEITWIPETFHSLLWLYPTLGQAGYYKKERYVKLRNQYDEMYQLFINHYFRRADFNGQLEFKGESNYR